MPPVIWPRCFSCATASVRLPQAAFFFLFLSLGSTGGPVDPQIPEKATGGVLNIDDPQMLDTTDSSVDDEFQDARGGVTADPSDETIEMPTRDSSARHTRASPSKILPRPTTLGAAARAVAIDGVSRAGVCVGAGPLPDARRAWMGPCLSTPGSASGAGSGCESGSVSRST